MTISQSAFQALIRQMGTDRWAVMDNAERLEAMKEFQAEQAARQAIEARELATRRAEHNARLQRAFIDRQAIVGALLLQANITPRRGDQATARLLEYGEARYGDGLTLAEASRDVLALEGLPDPQNTPGRIYAAFSSTTGLDILAGVANVAFQAAYDQRGDTTAGWVNEREIADFRENYRPRTSSPEGLVPLPRGGTADHLHLNIDEGEQYKAMRYAKQFQIDERDAADQDLLAFVSPATQLGRAARKTKADLVYAELLRNAALGVDSVALFHSTHSNLSTTAALAAATLDTAIRHMRLQREEGSPINVVPRYLLIPPSLEGLAHRLVRDMTTEGAPIVVRVEPRLELGCVDPRDGSSQSGSTSTWYLAAGDSVPTIEFGARTAVPEIRTSKLTKRPGRWGWSFDVNWDIGCKALDFRGLSKNTA